MTLTQLEYLVAVDAYRHFSIAAEKCFVTQPTLSMQIQKLEDELAIKLFDRSKQPVVPTEIGITIIQQAKVVLREARQIKQLIDTHKDLLSGELRLGIIPTLAPYLLPLFINSFIEKYPNIYLKVVELTTDQLIQYLKNEQIDVAIAATPLHDEQLVETPLFYEELVAFVGKTETAYKKDYILSEDIDLNHLWLLEEGHCLRSQILNICELRKNQPFTRNFEYQAGSVETLRQMVETSGGITILPELATHNLDTQRLQQLRFFKHPAPIREVSLITYRHFVKKNLIEKLKMEILSHIPAKIKHQTKGEVIPIV